MSGAIIFIEIKKMLTKSLKCGNMDIYMENRLKCPKENCQSEHVVSHGTVTTVKKGKRQRMKCQECGKTFYKGNE